MLGVNGNEAGQLQEVRDQEFTEDQVVVDGKRFIDCTFSDCEVVFKGGHFTLENCDLHGLRFQLEGAALRTLKLLSVIYNASLGAGGKEYVEMMFDIIREGPPEGWD